MLKKHGVARSLSRGVFVAALIAANGLVVLTLGAKAASANCIVNGDFEWPGDTVVFGSDDVNDYPHGWTWYESGINKHCPVSSLQTGTAAIGGSGISAFLERGYAHAMRQALAAPTGTSWAFEMDFASADPGSGDDRSLHLLLEHGTYPGGNDVILRVVDGSVADDGLGSLQVYTGSAYATVFDNVIPFSSEITTSPEASHLKAIGNYSTGAPKYQLFLTVGGNLYSSAWLSHFRTAPTAGNQGLRAVSFSSVVTTAAGYHLIDNISVAAIPEPSTATLSSISLGMLAGLGWYRCRRKGVRPRSDHRIT